MELQVIESFSVSSLIEKAFLSLFITELIIFIEYD